MIPWQVGWGGEGEPEGGLTGVEFASSSAVFHALQSKPRQTMRRESRTSGIGLLRFRLSSPTQPLAPVSHEGGDPLDLPWVDKGDPFPTLVTWTESLQLSWSLLIHS